MHLSQVDSGASNHLHAAVKNHTTTFAFDLWRDMDGSTGETKIGMA